MEVEACVSVQSRYGPGRSEEEAHLPVPARPAGGNSERRKGSEQSTLIWFAFRPIAVCLCTGGRARVTNTGGSFAAHAYQLSTEQTFSPVAVSLRLLTVCSTCVKTFLKKRSICSTYITAFSIIILKRSFQAHVLLNRVQVKLSFPHSET